MVGWVIQLFTLNLLFDGELFVRLGAVVFAAINTWLIHRIATRLHSPQAGLHAALFYTASLYTSIIAGLFILPDTPEVLFWLLSLDLFLRILPAHPIEPPHRRLMLLAGITVGLTMLSKYHGVFLWVGAGLYILLFNRRWLLTPHLYLAGIFSGLVFLPVIIWNAQNDFISLTFQAGRVAAQRQLRLDYFFTELAGQVAYQNPIVWALMIAALVATLRGRSPLPREQVRMLLLFSIPLIGLFLFFALFRRTLPHWCAPGYLSLMILAAAYTAERAPAAVPRSIKAAVGLTGFIAVTGTLVLLFLPMHLGKSGDPLTLGEGDATLDFHGWAQIREGFARVAQQDEQAGNIVPNAPILTYRWFPAGHLDYYVAHTLGRKLLVYGELDEAHRFAWINRWRGDMQPGEDAYYIHLSNFPRDAHKMFGPYFGMIEEAGTIPVLRGGAHVRNAVVYRLKNCIETPPIEAMHGFVPGG